ncbi:MAG: hypothetical protein M2R45_03955 [Verrucomicrobia subdivision 3 bacterium]|nr:hypothetical protein [Limisphaerales bacterium]MCS1415525.1 hypothetical protein [Limisphaerales bacterium]
MATGIPSFLAPLQIIAFQKLSCALGNLRVIVIGLVVTWSGEDRPFWLASNFALFRSVQFGSSLPIRLRGMNASFRSFWAQQGGNDFFVHAAGRMVAEDSLMRLQSGSHGFDIIRSGSPGLVQKVRKFHDFRNQDYPSGVGVGRDKGVSSVGGASVLRMSSVFGVDCGREHFESKLRVGFLLSARSREGLTLPLLLR